jgi:GcrA cell cycle regulator
MSWNEEMDAILKRMAAEKATAAQIGEAVGKTRNAVIGRAHRKGVKLLSPKLNQSQRVRSVTPARVVFVKKKEPWAPPTGERPKAQVITLAFKSAKCKWPIGHPGEADFKFCEAATVPGCPYCPEHRLIAYQPPRERVRQP